MKTSNKLILFFCLSAFGIICAIQLALFANFRRGIIHTDFEMAEERFDLFRMQKPTWLSVKGHIHVNIFPADSFHIELEKSYPGLNFRRNGDTLVISGYLAGEKEPHDSWNAYWQLPRVNVYCPDLKDLKGIRIEDSYVAISNPKDLPAAAASFTLKDAQLWIGAFNPEKDSVFRTESFDSIRIDETNSTVVINRQAAVKILCARLDNLSEIIDRFSRIDTGQVTANHYARIYMTAGNFNHIAVFRREDNDAGPTPGPCSGPRLSPAKSIIVTIRQLKNK